MAAHAYLKNEFTQDKKCQNLMSWLNFVPATENFVKANNTWEHLINLWNILGLIPVHKTDAPAVKGHVFVISFSKEYQIYTSMSNKGLS